jgi:hypothetical protein
MVAVAKSVEEEQREGIAVRCGGPACGHGAGQSRLLLKISKDHKTLYIQCPRLNCRWLQAIEIDSLPT